jgi:AcrR family transcriptional regulator
MPTDAEMSTRRRPGRRARLSRDLVLQAALALADEGGLEALTMQGVARRLGAEAMSLYRHVRNKEDILDGLVDLVFGEIELAPPGTEWHAAMRRRAISAREALARHPWAIGLLESASRPGPANLRHHDAVLGLLREAGFSSLMATHAYNLLDSFIYGFALQERTLPVATPQALAEFGEAFIRQLPGAAYPHLAAVGSDLMAIGFNYGDEFEFGLDLILDALARAVQRDAAGQG